MNTFTIITAADASHFGPVQNLCWMLARFEPAAKVILWDLGLTADQLKTLNALPPFALKNFSVRQFDFTKYPAYFDMANNFGQYAWKPVIVADAVAEFGGMVVWLDAGNFFRTPLGGIRATLAKTGFYAPALPYTIRSLTHPDTLTAMSAEAVADEPMRDACVVGFNAAVLAAVTLAGQWKAGAMNPAVIAPAGSNKANHRQDQSVLSVLACQSGLPLEGQWFGIVGHRDWMSLGEVKFQLTGRINAL